MKAMLSVSAVAVVVFSLFLYVRTIKNKQTTPNLGTLILWVATAVLNAVTYMIIVKDPFKFLPLLVSLGANTLLIVVTIRSKNYEFSKKDKWIVGATIIVSTLLWFILTVKDIHIVVQVVMTIAYIPLLRGLFSGKGKEKAIVWKLILLSTLLNLGAVLVEYKSIWDVITLVRSIAIQLLVLYAIHWQKNHPPKKA